MKIRIIQSTIPQVTVKDKQHQLVQSAPVCLGGVGGGGPTLDTMQSTCRK